MPFAGRLILQHPERFDAGGRVCIVFLEQEIIPLDRILEDHRLIEIRVSALMDQSAVPFGKIAHRIRHGVGRSSVLLHKRNGIDHCMSVGRIIGHIGKKTSCTIRERRIEFNAVFRNSGTAEVRDESVYFFSLRIQRDRTVAVLSDLERAGRTVGKKLRIVCGGLLLLLAHLDRFRSGFRNRYFLDRIGTVRKVSV